MKTKFFLLITCLLCTFVGVFAQTLELNTTTGQTLKGKFVQASDTSVTITLKGAGGEQDLVIPASRIIGGTFSNKDRLYVFDGKISILSQNDMSKSRKQIVMGNPNVAIGRAIKNAGTVSMTIGIPCLAAGVATCIAGHIKNNTTIDTTDPTKAAEDAKAIADKEESKGKMKEASYYLLSTGSALTIVGIPLHICGKRIMELNVNYTGNGAGLALKF